MSRRARGFALVTLLVWGASLLEPGVRESLAWAGDAPAAITDPSRNVDRIDDFLRIIFLPSGVQPIGERLIGSPEFQQTLPQLCQG